MRKRKNKKLAQKGMKTKPIRKVTMDQEKGAQAEKMSQKKEKPAQELANKGESTQTPTNSQDQVIGISKTKNFDFVLAI